MINSSIKLKDGINSSGINSSVNIHFFISSIIFIFTFINSLLNMKQKLNQRNNLRTRFDYKLAVIAYLIVHFLFALFLSVFSYNFPKITLAFLLFF